MSLAVEVASDGVRAPLSRDAVSAIVRATLRAERVRRALLSITFVSARRIAALNARYLGHRGPTDVISFQLGENEGAGLTGDVYISPEVARDNARAAGVGTREEVARLVVHGTLHVVGHHHPEGTGRTHSLMWTRQEQLVARTAREWRR
jgi:probable rRNA maturation factor